MKESEVREMAASGVFENARLNGKVEETHISWVILTRRYAFKIKKPLKLTFLDFSTPDLRKALCEKEVLLNSRFSDIYLSVQPVRLVNDRWVIGGSDVGEVVDYCVVMKRMALTKRMDNQLQADKVSEKMMQVLAVQIASFHNIAPRVFTSFDPEKSSALFNDIVLIKDFAATKIAAEYGALIQRSIDDSDMFLEKSRGRIQERIDDGLKRDVHGDLHSGNIFLYKTPVLFDCIEFNDEYRQIDVLYEVAFLCMDLEAFHKKHLSAAFLTEYKKHFPAFQKEHDEGLFLYFKGLRANIRAKVHAMSANQAENDAELLHHTSETKRYLSLMCEYMTHVRSFPIRTGIQRVL